MAHRVYMLCVTSYKGLNNISVKTDKIDIDQRK